MKQQIVFLCLLLAIGAKASPELFIVNGTNAQNPSPSYCHITYTNGVGIGFFGGGHIISNTHVLTAAHIITNFIQWNVGFGSTVLAQLQRVTSTNALAHPNYNPDNRANDIGIIILPSALVLNKMIVAIALPRLDQRLPIDNEQGCIYGFGYKRTASEVQVGNDLAITHLRVTIQTQCLQSDAQISADQEFCADDLERPSYVCLGNYGGGLIIPYRGVDVLVGILSRTSEICNTLSPAKFTRVSHYRAWIEQNTGV